MADAKHTPGPWVVGWGDGLTGPTTPATEPFCGGREWKYEPVSKGEETIAVVPAQDCLTGDYMANARLIAAAPELLEALQAAFSMLGEQELKDVFGYDWHGKARAALAKASA